MIWTASFHTKAFFPICSSPHKCVPVLQKKCEKNSLLSAAAIISERRDELPDPWLAPASVVGFQTVSLGKTRDWDVATSADSYLSVAK